MSCTERKTHECFSCMDCAQVNAFSPMQKIMCRSSNVCVMLLTPANMTMRGCYEGMVSVHCDKYPDRCIKCRENNCNGAPVTTYCHQCTPWNPMCPYMQTDHLSYDCEGIGQGTLAYSFTKKTMCFSGIEWVSTENLLVPWRVFFSCSSPIYSSVVGRVTRGCIAAEKDCSKDFVQCRKCNHNYCNRESFVYANCLECVGQYNSPCANNVTFLASSKLLKLCPVPYETPHCYVSVRAGMIRRGCVADKYKEVFLPTCTYSQDCFFCDGENCNYWSLSITEVKTGANTIYRIMRQYFMKNCASCLIVSLFPALGALAFSFTSVNRWIKM